jgi:hypothetical protein
MASTSHTVSTVNGTNSTTVIWNGDIDGHREVSMYSHSDGTTTLQLGRAGFAANVQIPAVAMAAIKRMVEHAEGEAATAARLREVPEIPNDTPLGFAFNRSLADMDTGEAEAA